MAAHPTTGSSHGSHEPKIKPHFTAELSDIKGISKAPEIDDKVTWVIKGRVDSISKDRFTEDEKKQTRIGIEIDSIESTGHLSGHNSSHGGLPGHKA